jgi:hypothetical protein
MDASDEPCSRRYLAKSAGLRLKLPATREKVAQHLEAQPLLFLVSDPAAIGRDHEREALVDIRVRNDRAVDDRGRLAHRGVRIAEDGELARQVEAGIRRVRNGLRCGDRRSGEAGHHESGPDQPHAIVEFHARPIPTNRNIARWP